MCSHRLLRFRLYAKERFFTERPISNKRLLGEERVFLE